MPSINELNSEIIKIKERNKNVERDKAWETSYTRKILIIILTYIVVVVTLYFLNLPNPLTGAIVPVIAFFLSTLTIPLFKKWWLENSYKN